MNEDFATVACSNGKTLNIKRSTLVWMFSDNKSIKVSSTDRWRRFIGSKDKNKIQKHNIDDSLYIGDWGLFNSESGRAIGFRYAMGRNKPD